MSARTTKRKTPKNRSKSLTKKVQRLFIWLCIFIIFASVYSYSFDTKLDLNGDNANYYLLGKSINSLSGYNIYSDLFAQPHNHFPPGYPLIIGIAMIISKSPLFIKFVNGLFFLGSLILSYEIFTRCKIKWQVALTSVVVIALNYHLINSSVIMMSEIPFLFFSLLCIWIFMGLDFSKKFYKNPRFLVFLLFLSFSFHIRTAGIALLGGFMLFFLLKKNWEYLASSLAGFTLLALPWFLRGKILGLTNSYQTQLLSKSPYNSDLGKADLTDFLERGYENIIRYISKEIPSGVLPFLEINYKQPSDWFLWTIGILLILSFIFALFKLPKYRMLFIGYLGGSFAILMLWPKVWIGTRFLIPLLPLICFLMIYAVSVIVEKGFQLIGLKKAITSYSSFLLLIPLIALNLQKFVPNQDQNWQSYPVSRLKLEAEAPYPLKWEKYIEIAEYAKKNLEITDIIACRKPGIFHIFSDRFTCRYPFESDQAKFIQYLKERNVSYVVIDQLGYSSTSKYLVPVVNSNPANFRSVLHKTNPDTYLFRFFPPN